jgi:glycosyltransferase involved in cell wall biosynthesis
LLRKPTIVEHHGYQANCPNGLLLFEPDHTVCPGHFMAGNYRKCVECNTRRLRWFGSARSLLYTFIRRWLCHRVARNIAITDHLEMRVKLPRTCRIYYGVPDGGMRLSHAPNSGRRLEIGYVGRLVQEKGLPVLLKAAKQLDNTGVDFHLTFVGDGPQQVELKAISDKLSLNEMVIFTGDLRGADLDKALRAIQVVVMPSEWEETAGLAAIEQMMSGGAVIVANIGGLAEVVGEVALKFAPGNSEELSLYLRMVAKDRRKIEELGSMARVRALKEFSIDRFIMQHVALYQQLQKAVPPKEHVKAESRQDADAGD